MRTEVVNCGMFGGGAAVALRAQRRGRFCLQAQLRRGVRCRLCRCRAAGL
jgi:hypothetical protein